MKVQVHIVGGKSSSGRVSILSDEFLATARSNEDGEITCEVRRHSSLAIFLYRNKHLPIPRVIRMMLFLVSFMTRRDLMFLGIFAGILLVDKYLPSDISVFFGTSGTSSQYGWLSSLGMTAGIMVGMMVYGWSHVATWHGAEHMAIAAYERNGSTDIQHIANECPVQDKCGGRMILPLMTAMIASVFVAGIFDVSRVIVSLVAWEGVMWVDKLAGWDKIPGTSHASHFLQRFITTRVPGKQELLTAQRALRELVVAHNP
ncbi:MAG: hypothetical protein A2655_03460 [Candidatus Yanofskybacteria bacterium RIFCSPHIGHO2_01_FULL_43_42]|uniref:Uncharacterized protein n=1 Tax=Candidatus Yanofskybacteria bacterium RIFCSPLOWO2_01_FULL_43_22 TaxID=1802695 RepID=A0A1F8GK53_9BACT|nr:MAG: hypothetical protein A2655_03460 [Candidatus Yanofskybacteria bacterium RIFCSPHIGHO2_01_FULL_43_42]OGN13862.1 MAG: hypothetical protein A3D48_02140 [Candidatus Yanofskybacteria bacterium RIFCSPHIGHO2_02_FULL_43_17]OGN25390.1 MAG: hypothetical protein A3A13_03355 [Candidatus Yanofskybacteria bacterium RIFCSPLOWO2_01_FULL_43_22]